MISTTSVARAVAPLFACAALMLPALGCGGPGAADASAAKNPLLGAAAPELSTEAVGGDGPKSLKEAQGKVVIVDFWGTFCDPCKKSFPKYQEIVDQYPGEVAVIAVAVDDPDTTKKEQLVDFAKDAGAKFAIVWDKDHSAVEKYGMRALTMPSSFVVDKTGTVRHVHVGFKDGEEAQIAAEVKELLGK